MTDQLTQASAARATNHNNQRGFSIIEMLLASAIGMFIIMGVMTLYASNKDTYRLQSSMSYVQRNGNFALDRLRRRIQEAGYSGFYPSFTDGVENALNTPNDDRWDLSQSITGFENVTNSDSYLGISGLIAGSDAISLKTMKGTANLAAASTGTTVAIAQSSGFSASNILILTDQDQASIFQANAADNTTVTGQTSITVATGTSPAPGNTATLGNTYDLNATVGKLESYFYYLKNGANSRPALFEARLITSPSESPAMEEKEMIADVEDMQIIYGVDTDNDGDIDRYDTASTVDGNTDWDKVSSVGVSLLLASDSQNITSDTNSWSFDATRFSFVEDADDEKASDADKRLRRSFTTYITMKN